MIKLRSIMCMFLIVTLASAAIPASVSAETVILYDDHGVTAVIREDDLYIYLTPSTVKELLDNKGIDFVNTAIALIPKVGPVLAVCLTGVSWWIQIASDNGEKGCVISFSNVSSLPITVITMPSLVLSNKSFVFTGIHEWSGDRGEFTQYYERDHQNGGGRHF